MVGLEALEERETLAMRGERGFGMEDGIQRKGLRAKLEEEFHTKDLGMLKYFLGVEVTRSKKGKLGAKPCSAPMTLNMHLTKDGELFEDSERYRRLVGKLNYLTMTRPYIAYLVSVVNADWAGSKMDRRSTSGYCVFVGGNLVSWKSKKQNVVLRSNAESEYMAMAQSVCEIIWIYQLLTEVGLKTSVPAKL
ncbi:uncharacterized mitochondrial protein AtMg00810-like [Humulus lupulus]|uniref:uncharacterized mitochondrial protein AtMg00810-like n=1 Tax=Humulus lupulus TaxID=3486 RepID=UPI002B40DE4E|nr:uncharacterized mitochondrial protein AtMg00810-like [Humulus lupulus]